MPVLKSRDTQRDAIKLITSIGEVHFVRFDPTKPIGTLIVSEVIAFFSFENELPITVAEKALQKNFATRS